MNLQMKQQVKMTQQLVMTPQLQMAIKLLQLSRLELSEVIQQEIAENPVLEEEIEQKEGEGKVAEGEEASAKEEAVQEVDVSNTENLSEIDWETYAERYEPSMPEEKFVREDDDRPSLENRLVKDTSLADHLIWQLQISNLSDPEKLFATQIIYDLDDDGRLTSPLREIAERAQVDMAFAERVLLKVQEFEPIGVAARDLKECLLIQARYHELGEIVEQVIERHLPNLERRNYRAVAKDLGIPVEEVFEAVKKIHDLEPKPGRPFSGSQAQYITPDIYIKKVGDDYVVLLNDDGMPKLRISKLYQNLLLNKDENGKPTKDYIKEKLDSARWLIRSIEQWQRTICKVTASIVKFQREFLDKGVLYLKPLVLRDVAEDIGMHESTVSRVTTNKYVHTPQGIFELKYFFTSGIRVRGSEYPDQDAISSESVKDKIRRLIEDEDPKKPYSDQNIVDLLAKDGIKIARRTVTKYREAMHIPSSTKRKRYF
ncbi:MAG: RNA polymerase sigma-54 factor [Deltaproteobacteria bacterium]|nr:MAG: RNA polymerase sigma-54 factor [Deltaproteobacteria bacterium]